MTDDNAYEEFQLHYVWTHTHTDCGATCRLGIKRAFSVFGAEVLVLMT